TQQLIGINLIVVASITNTLLAKRHSKAKAKQTPRAAVAVVTVADAAVLDSAVKS
ncbi:EamA family transporter, partial [Vibrio sp. 10N.261.48.A2]